MGAYVKVPLLPFVALVNHTHASCNWFLAVENMLCYHAAAGFAL
jgi:hypothetical protein